MANTVYLKGRREVSSNAPPNVNPTTAIGWYIFMLSLLSPILRKNQFYYIEIHLERKEDCQKF